MNQTVKHKFTSVLLAFVLAFSTLGVTSLSAFTDTAFAEDVWTDVSQESELLTTSGHYKLQKEITLGSTYVVSRDIEITIDLNGHTLAGPNNMAAIEIYDGGSLTIIDSGNTGQVAGKYDSGTEEIVNAGTLIIKGGYFNGKAKKVISNTGSITIYGGTFDATTNYAIYNDGDGTVSISDGIFNSTGEEVLIYNKATFKNGDAIKITGGTFTNLKNSVIETLEGSLVVNGGTLRGLYPVSFKEPATLSVSDGTFISEGGGTCIKYLGESYPKGQSVVTGGAFSDSVSTYVDPSFTVEVEAIEGDAPYSYGKNFDKAVESAVRGRTGATVTAINNALVATDHHLYFTDGDDLLAIVYQNKTKGVLLPSLTKEGYKFHGWSDGTDTLLVGMEYIVPSGVSPYTYTILTAQWNSSETDDPNEDPTGEPGDESNIVVVDKEASGMTVDPDSKLDVAEGDKVRVEVWPVYKRSDEYKTISGKISELSDLTGVYDVTLFVNGIQKSNGFGTITLMFPVDTKYNDRLVRVWYIHGDDEPESKYSVVVDGKVSFGTQQLSVFGVEILDPAEYPSSQKPNTKDPYTQEMYRLYNPNSGEHLYTADEFERDCVEASGWDYEGVAWIAPVKSNTPVYRLYSGTDHHYTTDVDERDMLLNAGWTDEGIGWYSDDAQGCGALPLV